MEEKKSGRIVASEHVAALEQYLAGLQARGEPLPSRADGRVNLTKVAKDSGLTDRGRFYTNGKLMKMVESAVAERQVERGSSNAPTEASKPLREATDQDQRPAALQRAERQVHRLEQSNAALVAENAELRRQLRSIRLQLGREDMIIETARRMPAPSTE